MSFTNALDYVREKLNALGYREHDDIFDEHNIPSTVVDKSYCLEFGTISSSRASHIVYTWTVPIKIKMFLNGYSKPVEAYSDAVKRTEAINDELFKVEDRYSSAGIQSVKPDSISFSKLTNDADHIIVTTMDIEATVNVLNSENCP